LIISACNEESFMATLVRRYDHPRGMPLDHTHATREA
jgi:hypothetical protein